MAIDPVDSALDAIAAHFSALQVPHQGSQVALQSRRGWPEKNERFDFSIGPVLTVTANNVERDEQTPFPVREGPLVLWQVATLVISGQLDLWGAYRVNRDQTSQIVRTALHDDIPFRVGLHLTQADYFDRPITVHATAERNPSSRFDASVGEWRRTWDLRIMAAEVVEAATPQQLEIILRTTGATLAPEDTTIVPP